MPRATTSNPYGAIDYDREDTPRDGGLDNDANGFLGDNVDERREERREGRDSRRMNRRNGRAEKEALQQLESQWETERYVDASDRQIQSLDELGGLQNQLQGMSSQESAGWQDARGNGAMLGALGQMQAIGGAGGYTDLERSQIAQAQYQANQGAQAQRQALQQQYQMRGMGGSGMEMASAMQANQAGANQASANATNIAAQAQNRALSAIQNSYSMGQGRTQTQAQAGAAADNWNQQNFQNQAAVQGAVQGNLDTRVQTNAAQEEEDFGNSRRGKVQQATDAIGGLI